MLGLWLPVAWALPHFILPPAVAASGFLQPSHLVSSCEGVIISIGDVEAYHTGPTHPAYAASK